MKKFITYNAIIINKIILLIGLIFCFRIMNAQWGSIVRLTNTDTESCPEGIAATNNYIHAIWYDYYTPGYQGILYARSTNYGANWSAPIVVDSVLEAASIITSCSSYVHLFLGTVNGSIMYRRSTNNGVSWSSPIELVSFHAWYTSIAVNQKSNIYIIYPRNDSVFLKKSTNNGTSWSSEQFIVWRDGINFHKLAADDSSRLHFAWDDNMGGAYRVYYKRSTNNGNNWESMIPLGGSGIYMTSIVADKANNVYVWASGNLFKSTNGGASWGNPISSWTWASLADDRKWLHGIHGNSVGGITEVLYSRSRNYAVTWDTCTISPIDGINSDWPYIALSDTMVHVLWRDFEPGNAEIYYRHSSVFTSISENRQDNKLSSFAIYPQPAKDIVYIITSNSTNKIGIKFYDISGKFIQGHSLHTNNKIIPVDIRNLPAGIYFVITESGGERSCQKMIICK